MNSSLKKHTAASAGLLMTASTALSEAAVIIERDVIVPVADGEFDLLFDPIDDVTDLVEFSDGSVSTVEGGTFVISAIHEDDSLSELYRRELEHIDSFSLTSLDLNDFTDLAPATTIKGLHFRANGGVTPGSVSLPANTTISFSAIPEPTALLSSIFGFLLIARRRR